MEDNTKLIESLFERTAEYGKTSYELAKLKAADKTTDGLSSFLPHIITIAIFGFFLLFFSLGIAFWLSEVLGALYYGFLLVAALYAFVLFVLHFMLHKWLKRILYDYLIRQLLK